MDILPTQKSPRAALSAAGPAWVATVCLSDRQGTLGRDSGQNLPTSSKNGDSFSHFKNNTFLPEFPALSYLLVYDGKSLHLPWLGMVSMPLLWPTPAVGSLGLSPPPKLWTPAEGVKGEGYSQSEVSRPLLPLPPPLLPQMITAVLWQASYRITTEKWQSGKSQANCSYGLWNLTRHLFPAGLSNSKEEVKAFSLEQPLFSGQLLALSSEAFEVDQRVQARLPRTPYLSTHSGSRNLTTFGSDWILSWRGIFSFFTNTRNFTYQLPWK